MTNYHWQSNRQKRSGVDDMVLLSQVSENSICENLKKRYMDDWIFTYIGPVLISVNPFKQMPYFTDKDVDMYQGAAQFENPPHVYALSDEMYRNLTIDSESQCVIISGESGAGKTVAAKYIMDYISRVSGGGPRSQHVKDVVKYSNPLLEAFGNAKTVRNNNSSRFGKYVEIYFNAGQPAGGEISNFLLEKSRVVLQNPGERNFHIFYQMIAGADQEMKDTCGIWQSPDYYQYLNSTEYQVQGTDDVQDWHEVLEAMNIMGMSQDDQYDVISTVSGILHLGNILFRESGTEQAIPENMDALTYPAHLLGVNHGDLQRSLVGHIMESNWGSTREVVTVSHNIQQAEQTRDALSKALYSRLFDYLVNVVNQAMRNNSSSKGQNKNIGILDIYGFEIFQNNGFEQFCINFVNEKLQQIFIQLTLKNEQEEYVQEGIKWKEIEYFNNKVVCDLIEGRSPPGVMAVLDDTSLTMNAVRDGADSHFKSKLRGSFGNHQHFDDSASGFMIHHYAGKVSYNVEGFVEKNRDILFTDIVEMLQKSSNAFVKSLFKEKIDRSDKKRPTTAGSKIKKQANDLVNKLMLCMPHYVRCIKPNETKKPHDWEQVRVMHQVEYLGLKENIRVRRAGFAYRRQFEKFVNRYAILTAETWPPGSYRDNVKNAVSIILKSVNIDTSQYELGKTKVFIKAPESLFLLEESRERKFDHHARVIQKAFRKHFSQQKLLREKEEAADIFYQKKERREESLNRNFFSDYIGLDHRPELRALVGKREKVEFAQTVDKFDRRYRTEKRDLIVTGKAIFLIGREKKKDGSGHMELVETVKRTIPLEKLSKVCLSPFQDNLIILSVAKEYDTLLQITFKTEFVSTVARLCKEKFGKELKIQFDQVLEYTLKKSGGLSSLGGEKRKISFIMGTGKVAQFKTTGIMKKEATFSIGPGLPSHTRPRKTNPTAGKHHQQRGHGARQFGGAGAGQHTGQWKGGASHGKYGGGRPAGQPPGGWTGRQAPGHHESHELKPHRVAPGRPSIQNQSSSAGKLNNQSIEALKGAVAARVTRQNSRGMDQSFLNIPDGGASRSVRQSIVSNAEVKPLPGKGRPKPAVRKNLEKRVKALYDYDAQDVDELSLRSGDIIILIKEDESGWWTGKLGNKEGFFPGNYVEKI